ncbi:hypothetical protein RF11_09608 [Thelohanellus kitauei]|uniref:Mediator of RNA polymerase II transcription subunit 20 n=1 Tax=Thelohanellus kitauei TaxID=669202 RepID=A0A0C2MVR1_THEKT|nr:hypothetical protein RF11_09608 [Thelohanellus kitauei]
MRHGVKFNLFYTWIAIKYQRIYFGSTDNLTYANFLKRIDPTLVTLDARKIGEWQMEYPNVDLGKTQKFMFTLKSSECPNALAIITDAGNVTLATDGFSDILDKIKFIYSRTQKATYGDVKIKMGEIWFGKEAKGILLNCPCSSTDTFFPVLDSACAYLKLKNILTYTPRDTHKYNLSQHIDEDALLSDSFASTCVNYAACILYLA